MHILVTGGTGFIGEALLPALVGAGHRITVLTRQSGRSSDAAIAFVNALTELEEPADAVINLAGASLAGKRWNADYKREIVASRVAFTRKLGAYFAMANETPAVWLNASAIGFYGASDDTPLTEAAPHGEGFSATLCADWEDAARNACGEPTRLCLLRLGVVLDQGGGAFAEMAAPFRMGVANWLGSGRQYLSWIHRADVVAAMLFLLEQDALDGVFNLTAPTPVTSKEFCAAMRRVYRTLPGMPMPAVMMRALVGEMADELLLTGQRVVPQRLQEAGFTFRFPQIDDALAAIRGR